MRKRLTAILLSLSLALGLAPQIPASAEERIVFNYDDEGNRTSLKSIKIDPYTYYNVGDEDGGTIVDVTFLRNLVEDELLGKWSQLAEDIFRVNPKKAWFNKSNRDFDDYFNNSDGTGNRIDLSSDLCETTADGTNHVYRRSGLQYTTSLADVRNAMSVEMDDVTVNDVDDGYFFTNDGVSVNALSTMRDDTEKQDVFYNIVSTYEERDPAWNLINSFGIAFYGFDLTPISDEDLEYITAAEGYESLEAAQTAGASGVSYNSNGEGNKSVGYTENISREEAEMAVTLTNSNTTTLHNSITNEKNYSFSETIGSETKFSIGEVVEETINLEFSAEQAFGEARTQEEGVEKTIENSVTQTIVVPAHTAVAVEQQTGSTNITLEYDCPVAISYKVAIFSMNCEFSELSPHQHDDYERGCFVTYFEGDGSSEQGTSANENLYQRAVVGQGISGYDRANGVTDAYVHTWGTDQTETSDSIDWDAVLSNEHTSEKVKNIASFATKVPMASAGAEMEATSSSINSKIQSIVPLYNLNKVQLTTGEKAYEMSVDDSFPLDGLHVEGVNADKVAYYGFDENDGHWELTDAEGNVLTSNETAEIAEDALTGRKTLTAKQAGTVYLKWMLNDGVEYSSKNDATVISSENFDTLADTAYIKIDIEEIPFTGTIDVNGNYEGTVGAEPVNLNDVLDVTVYDESGKEVARPLTWEARQLDGITVEPGGDMTFEKKGTYQVRAVISDEVQSDWVTVYGGEKPFEGSVVLTGDYIGTVGAAADDLNKKLDVRVFDTDKKQVDRPVTWEASELDGIKVTEDGKVTFTKPGTYHVQAKVSDTVKSGWYEVQAENPVILDETIAVTGVTLSGAEKLSVGESAALTAAVAPANATDQALTFTSSSADVIKVDNSGRVTALKPGRATVTVTATGGKKASMQIIVTEPVVLPQGKALQGRKVKLTWNKVENADGYEVYGAVCNGNMKLQKVVKGKKLTLSKVSRKKLDKNKDYKFRIKAYRMIDGRKVYLTTSEDIHVKMTENSRYANADAVKVSKKKKTLSAGKTWRPKVTVKMTGKAKQMRHVQPVRFLSSDDTIASVTRTGKITARTKGTCFIYACAINGKTAKIKITVR